MTNLREQNWDVAYSHEDGDLVKLFFQPALSCATLYQRATGYFSGDVLALAARGIEAMLGNGGRMQLLVGCTLDPDDVEEIKKGYDVRDRVTQTYINRIAQSGDDPWARQSLSRLAWMIANKFLDVKLAIPLDENGKMRAGLGLYHAKVGIITDAAGDQLVFKGSINETTAGWLNNCESFDVSCSWRGEYDQKKVAKSAGEFGKLWSGQAKSAKVFDFPEALKAKLLEFLPTDDSFVKPPKSLEEDSKWGLDPAIPADGGVAPPMLADERRRRVWWLLKEAPKGPGGPMMAVETSAVKPWPHQLKAYKRMLDSWPFRLLIADEVGLGKTIEAGLIIRYVWISELAKRILIMPPAGVIRQWQAELYEKFNLLVPIYDGSRLIWPEHHARAGPLEVPVSRTEWTKQPIVLASSHLLRRQDRQAEVVSAADWDLIVLDEAHHARRGAPGTAQETGPNRLLRLMHLLKEKAKSLLLMTATPMQVHPVEMWDLLNLLGLPAGWNESAFVEYFDGLGQNPDHVGLHRAAKLFQVTEKMFGPLPPEEMTRISDGFELSPIDRDKTLAAIREPNTTLLLKRLSVAQRKAAICLLRAGTPIRHRMSRHTRALLREYYKRGLLTSPVAERDVTDLPVILSPSERSVYDAVEHYIATTYQAASLDKKSAVGFVMTIYRRRLASSFNALRKTLENRLGRIKGVMPGDEDERVAEDLPQDERRTESLGTDEAAKLESEALAAEEQGEIQGLIKSIAKLGTDTKAKELILQLNQILAAGYTSAIVFTQYTDTMDYLKGLLSEQLGRRIGCFSGRGGERQDASGHWNPCSKEQIKRMLREGQVEVLVCTDAAGEGLNLQSCGALVNYDLPWNPMKVEQRIGRIDRIGQKYPLIKIVNMAYADTVEADVYFALSRRIKLFKGLVGKLQPILSRLPQRFEQAVLNAAGDSEKARQEAVRDVEDLIEQAASGTFDIDEVSEADLQPPTFAPATVKAADMDGILRCPALLPPGVECQQLDGGTYSLRIPGESGLARITTSPDVFDDHFESHQLLLPDGPLYRKLVSECATGDKPDATSGVALGK